MTPESGTVLDGFFRHSRQLAVEIEQDAVALYVDAPYRFAALKELPDLFVLPALADYLACRPESLDPMTAEPVVLTAAAAASAPDCLRVHMAAARREGTSRQAIRDCRSSRP
jgi:AhpD family alkylhydroperoxidase